MNILTHLQNGGSLTPRDALNMFGSFRLAAHIESLRKDGHNIFTSMVSEDGKKYAKYTYTRKSPKGPDFKGFIVLECDYKAGEKLKIAAWQKPTSRGNSLLALKEDNWSKKKREEERQDKEIAPSYARKSAGRFGEDDSEIPF